MSGDCNWCGSYDHIEWKCEYIPAKELIFLLSETDLDVSKEHKQIIDWSLELADYINNMPVGAVLRREDKGWVYFTAPEYEFDPYTGKTPLECFERWNYWMNIHPDF